MLSPIPLKTRLLTLAVMLFLSSAVSAQMCPGGAVNFASGAVTFDPGWIYGCNTGTSCNGGVNFDNRLSCQPTTAMDACAPAPTCGTLANNASNIWFKFYAAASTVTISCFQNTSFVIGVQAFTGGPTCGSLTQVGCALAGGPSSGVNLTMTGLTVGQLYYYRIFGSSGPESQRTGLYCFCGTTGLTDHVLASGLQSFKGYTSDNAIRLIWEVSDNSMPADFEIEMSSDQMVFNTVGRVSTSFNRNEYSFSFAPGDSDDLYYRLRYINASGAVIYSPVLKLKTKGSALASFTYLSKSNQLRIRLQKKSSFILCNVPGNVVQQFSLSAGENLVSVKNVPGGVYFVKNVDGAAVQKIVVVR